MGENRGLMVELGDHRPEGNPTAKERREGNKGVSIEPLTKRKCVAPSAKPWVKALSIVRSSRGDLDEHQDSRS